MADTTILLQEIRKTIDALEMHHRVCIELSIPSTEMAIYDEAISFCRIACDAIEKKGTLPENYINSIIQNINNVYSVLPYKNKNINLVMQKFSKPISSDQKKSIVSQFTSGLINNFKSLRFILRIFINLDFFENNIVLIGANGSGKTTLANRLKDVLNPANGIVISAQRVLRVSKYNAIDSVSQTTSQLKNFWGQDKTYKNVNSYNNMQNEFDIVLKNLVADNVSKGLEYSHLSKGNTPESPSPETNLDNTIKIWNSLISHRELVFADDHMNIIPKTKEDVVYELVQMSEGEKVMLYLIAQVLQAPEKGFIIVDEPEIYLHRSILRKLWDKLETERDDCIFIYLTHDIEFASTRYIAQKVWMRSYTTPDSWEFESIGGAGLPEELLLELLGSQKKILFCEGEIGGDEVIYNILFPDFTIKPVGSCKNVIDYVRAFNKIDNRLANALGIVDSDFKEEVEVETLESDSIFCLDVAEIENLLLDEEFLKICAERLHLNNGEVESVKASVIKKFSDDIEMQASHFITSRVNYLFNNSHVERGNDIAGVVAKYENFTSQIEIEQWHSERKQLLKAIAEPQNYTEIIKKYNNKGLKAIVARSFKKGDFASFAIKELKNNPKGQEELRKHFPENLAAEHNN